MGFNVKGTVAKDTAVQLTLAEFGGRVTDWPPMNLPQGASPENEECIFNPGKVGSRPAFKKVFATPIGTATFTYGKTYIDPLGVIRNLYLTSDGQLLVQTGGFAGIPASIGSTTPGTFAKSVTAFGREYIAISDGLHGQEVPLQYDGTNLDRVTQDGPGAPPTVANLALPSVDLDSLTRASNVVTAVTASPHGLLVGYQALIANIEPLQFTVSSLIVNNTSRPGIAEVTTTVPHGLTPGLEVLIGDIGAVDVPASIVHALRESEVTTITFSAPHGLSPGAIIAIVGTVDNSFLGRRTVVSADALTVSYPEVNGTPFNAAEIGNARLLYPSDSSTTVLILSCPTATTFQYALDYSNAQWLSGTVSFAWNSFGGAGFYVSKVIDPVTFTYAQNGPDATVSTSTSPQTATVTPFGQIAPGLHQMVVLYLTRNFAITRPSPPVLFTANGGQYLQVTDLPIGPSDVIARILAFTGTEGSEFFYIPVPAEVNSQLVGTATQIDDNTTTSVILDFGDPTLFAGINISQMGNDLFSQIIVDSCLGFAHYADRLLVYGLRNRIQNMLGMSFDSGAFPSAPTIPTGWTANATPGALATGHFGEGFSFLVSGNLSQSFYLDAFGAQIGRPNQKYKFRVWLDTGVTVTASIFGGSPLFSSDVTITAGAAGWYEGNFSNAMPAVIPADMTFAVTGNGLVDEMSIIYADNPYLDEVLFGSYRLNPEGIDGVSGELGPSEDTHKIMDMAVIRGTLYLLTRDPSGRLHSTVNNGVTEPAGWTVSEVATQCGALSAFGLTTSQADDATGAGGEEWFAWASQTGVRIFSGNEPWKISQEIQPDWRRANPAALLSVWALNDTVARRMYFGVAWDDATAPSVILVLDYTNLDTAYEIAQAQPVGSGRRANADYSRKWTIWKRPMNSAAILFAMEGQSVPVFMGGNGQTPDGGSPPPAGFGNVYYLATQQNDDDYGQFFPFYVTYFFPVPELEGALGLGAQRKILAYLQFLAQIPDGPLPIVGYVQVSVLVNQLSNVWPLKGQRNLVQSQDFDQEWPGGNPEGQRMAIKFEWFPGSV